MTSEDFMLQTKLNSPAKSEPIHDEILQDTPEKQYNNGHLTPI